jgi:transcriptional regulator
MYTPKLFQITDPEAIRKFIRENGFGILVSQGDGQLFATHIPLLLSNDGTKLTGHVARGNRQWKTFEQAGEVLAIFSGPHAYISASWYDHENVSTWNYVAVHVYGTLRVQSNEELTASLKHLVDKYEKDSEKPVHVEDLSADYLKHALMGVVGFEIDIQKMEGSYKLSQNRDKVNHEVIVRELEKRGDAGSKEVAGLMKIHGYKG